jgi:uncharacterized protein YbjT (DUF2867 family)
MNSANPPDSPVIVIAGASGYIGRALIPRLLGRFPRAQIIALSRAQQSSEDPRVQWKACDLFSLKSIENALPLQADLAFYLVHSMGPTAQLDQASFADYDLILADNFARAVSSLNLKQLIYLGGLTPDTLALSLHLQSRLEVEETFKSFKIPTTIFRAALILGDEGSSFQILLKLVRHLPVMICPQWTQTLTTPVDLDSVLSALTEASLKVEHSYKTYDLAGCEPLTYIEMMKQTAQKMGLRRYFLTVPFFSPTLSRLWVSLVTNTSKDLVYPLIESLEHPMVARKNFLFQRDALDKKYTELLDKASLKTHPRKPLFSFQVQRKTVRSVQRLPLPSGKNAKWVKEDYESWLPQFLAPLILVYQRQDSVVFSLLTRQIVLLELQLNEARSNPDRQLLSIVGGLMVAKENKGRLEFRVVLNRKFALAAIHDFRPALPWYIYKYTQAAVHLLVMNAFARHLQRELK